MTNIQTFQTSIDAVTFLTATLPLAALFAYTFGIIWVASIKPRLIPRRIIEREAEEIIATFPDPLREVTARCERVWHAEESWKAVYWRRVQTVIRRRMAGAVG